LRSKLYHPTHEEKEEEEEEEEEDENQITSSSMSGILTIHYLSLRLKSYPPCICPTTKEHATHNSTSILPLPSLQNNEGGENALV